MSAGLRLFGHPVHPMLSDLPIGLFSTSVLWETVALWRGGLLWWQFAFWSVAGGVALALPTAAAGFVDFASLGDGHPAEKTATAHLMAMMSVVTCFGCSLIWLRPGTVPTGSALVLALLCTGVGFLGLTVGGWLGGDLVFKHGLGTTPQPKEMK